MSKFNLFSFLCFMAVLVLSPSLIMSSSSRTANFSTVTLNITRMSELIKKFMSFNATASPDLPPNSISFSSSSPFSIPIYPRESITKYSFKDYESIVRARINHDLARMKMKQWRRMRSRGLSLHQVDDPHRTGVFDATGLYVAPVSVGTPGLRQELLIDSGSELIWWYCHPCKNCPKPHRTRPRYEPKKSSSYDPIKCADPICKSTEASFIITGCDPNKLCRFEEHYEDRSYTKGEMIYERLSTLGGAAMVDRLVAGCSREIGEDDAVRSTGLLGIDQGRFSLITQMHAQNFSLCLPSHYQDLGSEMRIHFFPKDEELDGITARLIPNPDNSNYYVRLSSISVGSEIVPIPEDVWAIKNDGSGGVVLDTGSYLTWLQPQAYVKFRDMFRQKAYDLGLQLVTGGSGELDTCYSITLPLDSVKIPSIEFNFVDAERPYILDADQILDKNGEGNGVYCLAFVEGSSDDTILGTWQFQKTRLSFDLPRGLLNLSPRRCS